MKTIAFIQISPRILDLMRFLTCKECNIPIVIYQSNNFEYFWFFFYLTVAILGSIYIDNLNTWKISPDLESLALTYLGYGLFRSQNRQRRWLKLSLSFRSLTSVSM